MYLIYRYLFPAMWMLWMIYWWIASRNSKQTIRRQSLASRSLHVGVLTLVALLLWSSIPVGVLNERFLPATAFWFWTGATITAAGLLFAVWARLHLGGNWSGTVTIKRDHELITSGPYAFVRHPIYSGLLLALLGSAIARGEWWVMIAVVLAFWSIWWKLRIEERWLNEHFGNAYADYRERVAALIPFVL